MTWKEHYYQAYARLYDPKMARLQPTYAIINFLLALLTVGHSTTYLFGVRFFVCVLTVISDRYYEHWRTATYELGVPPGIPEKTRRFMETDLYQTCSQQHVDVIYGSQYVNQLQLFVGCVHRGWFEEAAEIQRYMD